MKNLQNYTSFINEGKSNNNDSKLLNAAETGDIEELTRLLKIVDVNLQDKDCWTALMFAALNGYIDCVKLLVDNNADVNLQDKDGWTALMLAAMNGETECAKLLVDNNADVNLQYIDGYSALMLAAINDHTETVKKLLDNSADVSLTTINGESVVNYTCKGIWKTADVQELIITRQPWNIKFFDDRIGFLPELKVKYENAFIISDLNI